MASVSGISPGRLTQSAYDSLHIYVVLSAETFRYSAGSGLHLQILTHLREGRHQTDITGRIVKGSNHRRRALAARRFSDVD